MSLQSLIIVTGSINCPLIVLKIQVKV